MKPAPTIAFSYLRYSSPAQSDGDSVRRQDTLRDGWLRRHPHVHLDSSLKDKGVSGFTGKHRTDKMHALARFIDEVERSRVPCGSYLIVENLDRLTREDPETSIPLVLSLIRAGVRVVQLAPTEMVYEPGMDFGRLMMMLWELSRGHAESKRKSGMLAEVWTEKKRAAGGRRLPHGKAAPAWLELVGAKRDGTRWDFTRAEYRVRPDAARVVKRIYRMAVDGLGVQSILKRLHAEKVPAIGRKPAWVRAYVTILLTNPAVLGVYQPMKGRGKREPDGEAIRDYFPRIIDDALWAKVQAARSRRGHPGCRAPRSRHVLAGLVVDARDGSVMYVHGHPKVGPMFLSSNAYEKKPGAVWATFPVVTLTDAILSRLVELRADELFADPGAARVSDLTGLLGEVERRLAKARERFDADPESQTWGDMVDNYDRERRRLVAELTAARQEAASPLSASWTEAVGLIRQQQPERLRAALNRTVEEIRVLVVKRNTGRLAVAQVRFPGGAVRAYLVYWRYRHRSVPAESHVPCTVWSLTAAEMTPVAAALDLRDPVDVAALEKQLADLDVAALEDEATKSVRRRKPKAG